MASVHDVAAYIRQNWRGGRRMKLLKLVYYAQAWSLVWDGRPLFDDDKIEAWPQGPVARSLWIREQHNPVGGGIAGAPEHLDEAARETIDEVVRFYGRLDGDQLSELTHIEQPWLDARGDLPASTPSRVAISNDAMRAFYSQLGVPPKHFPVALLRGYELMLATPPDERRSLLEESDDDAGSFIANLT